MLDIFLYILLGAIAGIFSGLVGVGGGVIIVPMLVFWFKFSQHLAQGTTLALLVPPIGILAAWTYYQEGYVDLKAAGLMCLGFIVGGWMGAKVASGLSNEFLEKLFGAAIIAIGLKMLWQR